MRPFRLATVLKHRKHVEEVLQRELAALQTELSELEADLRRRQARRRRWVIHYHERLARCRTTPEVLMLQQYLKGLDADIHALGIRVREATQAVECKRRALNEAVKGRKMLENLQEKNCRAHTAKQTKAEQKMSDESALRRFCGKP
jgi:flagellar FliJ protein